MGSNTYKEANIQWAQKQLTSYFPDIRFGSEQDTLPLGLTNPAHFTNQLAKFSTLLSMEKIKSICKQLESMAGRLPNDKKDGMVKLDIDLLIYDYQNLKESDLKKDYVIAGMKELDW